MESLFLTEIPEVFVHEYLDGVPMYYKGYKAVGANLDRVEEVSGTGGIHSFLASEILQLLCKKDLRDEYWMFGGRPGLQLSKQNIFCVDFAMVSKEKLPATSIGYGFLSTPPALAVEIDIFAECEHLSEAEYVDKKIEYLLNFGTQRVIWIFVQTRKILIAELGEKQIIDFNTDFVLVNEIQFNITRIAKEKGIVNLLID